MRIRIVRQLPVMTAIALGFGVWTSHLSASGPIGIYGVVEKVVFEPNEQAPERVQLWGAFAYVEGAKSGTNVSSAKSGYLYFRMPDEAVNQADTVRKEWADLKSVAGTGQAVGFGTWQYIGGFGALQPDKRPTGELPYILERSVGNPITDLRVRPATEAPANPSPYQTNAGVVKLSEQGSHAAIVKTLKDQLRTGR